MGELAGDCTDWHEWLRKLDSAEKKALETEIAGSPDRRGLNPHARQYYIHLAISSENPIVRRLSDEMVFAQLEGDDKRTSDIEDEIYAVIRESLSVGDESA